MIKKLDIHISLNVFKVYCAGQFAFFCLFIFIDLLDKAFKLNPPKGMSRFIFLCEYYLTQCPPLFQTTAPFVFVLCCLITFARFQHNSQIVAINAAGLSTFRVLENLMIMALLLGLTIFACQEWLTPRMTQLKIALCPDEYSDLMKKHLNFRDHCSLESDKVSNILAFDQKSAVIDIDEINIKVNSGIGFHATFMDENDRPRVKLFARSFSWDAQQKIKLGSEHSPAVIISYNDDVKLIPIDDAFCYLTIPLQKAILASVDFDALSFSDLAYFQSNLEAYTERIFRLLTPFFPFLMLLVSCVLALPLVFHKPVYAYFSGLGCCFGIFLTANFLKSGIERAELRPEIVIPVFVAVIVGIYLLRKDRVPT